MTIWHISHPATNWWTRPYLKYAISLYEYHIKYNQCFESWSNTSWHSRPANLCPYKVVDDLISRQISRQIPSYWEVAVNHLLPGYKRYWNWSGCFIVAANYLVTVSNIKRASYCLQVGACLIYSKLKQAHMDSGSDKLILLWLANKSKINEMYFY